MTLPGVVGRPSLARTACPDRVGAWHLISPFQGGPLVHAAWWWIDRWRKSTAFLTMSMEAQGVYRNLLDALWLFPEHVIPNDQLTLMKAGGCDADEWGRVHQIVLAHMRLTPDGWVNDTACDVIQQTLSIQRVRRDVGRLGGLASQANAQAKGLANANQTSKQTPQAKDNPPSPSPSPYTGSVQTQKTVSVKNAPKTAPTQTDVPSTQETRAAHFCEVFAELFRHYSKGAKYYRARPAVDFQHALGLVQTWDDVQLEKLARVFLNSDEPWIVQSTRSMSVFVSRVSWAETRLKEWEAAHAQ